MNNSNENKSDKHYLGHRKRLRDKLTQSGIENLQDYEIVELLLTFSIPQRDVKPIAKELLKKFGSIGGIFDASPDELTAIPYVKDKTVELVAFIKAVSAIYRKEKATERPVTETLSGITSYCIEKFGDKKEEEFYVIHLDSRFSLMQRESSYPGREFHFSGTIDRAVVYPRKIMEDAIKSKAYALVIAHNHPNGSLQPSDYDIKLTRALDLAAKSLGLILYDHLIVTSSSYFSFRENRLL